VVERATRVDGDFERTWDAVIEVFAERNWFIQNLEKDSGLIATDWMSLDLHSPYADCGTPGFVTIMGRSIRFNVLLREDGNATSVTVNVAVVEMQSNSYGLQRVDCTSTGRVERLIHDQVKRALSGRRTSSR
jgi:uncharacterized lipoprotein